MTLSKLPSEELFQAYRSGDKSAYRAIKGDMKELVRLVAHRYKDEAPEKKLIPIGMTYFDLALRKYIERRAKEDRTGSKLYKFSTYFTWWARESILTYLGRSTTPLRAIPRQRRAAARAMRVKPRSTTRGSNGRKQGGPGAGERTRRTEGRKRR